MYNDFGGCGSDGDIVDDHYYYYYGAYNYCCNKQLIYSRYTHIARLFLSFRVELRPLEYERCHLPAECVAAPRDLGVPPTEMTQFLLLLDRRFLLWVMRRHWSVIRWPVTGDSGRMRCGSGMWPISDLYRALLHYRSIGLSFFSRQIIAFTNDITCSNITN